MQRKRGAVDRAELMELKRKIVDRFEGQMSAFATSARLLDDGIIDPRDTRAVLSQVLMVCREGDARVTRPIQFAVARP
ncbi:MAG TPA: acyl-CoA carboxylase subunit beta, partial [Bellilinea sp.]|nr:acyl-CoA carboxylase subunit beta [Bellilinea sp.]